MIKPVADDPTPEDRLASLNIVLPEALPAFGQYVPAVQHGTYLWVGGHFGTDESGALCVGKCGHDVSAQEARLVARSAAINMLATLKATLKSLDRVEQIAQVYGVVNATPDFVEHTGVIDAASDVFVDVFGDAGRHSRLAVGVASLPANMVLEITAQIIIRGT